ncbi:YbhB/YbcL family Raf kinase inhibitor-like protein [Pediococcus claussenii]|uniref:Phosphatidylethanolamine-binding family protein n=1 Tax=Pediococcus claussenii (strain ATCC BAA-344 / DSM 14800 / JCM 18046 / KCTC 3811 / LMG 21948 / P06) TaxID=701521 RepID=G8PB94_PEDCP|nr:YbhB/YbcL family Raf kinase inhibitor-like protein [Pediococcus claussenii]AEV94723.1 phosphatidylethanolamine-binding family protein [Pediococcus claussenii ATCC BAA-344]ANZ69918.1 phospholipid-binding protein [Pediococcus claussenii]ANZ71735.1 phospholipid-binding protein [Pediococcus claussenii]KRN20902.1 hypothetical protein IV79_GL000127 [Pediococcus claussenii]
MKITVNFENGFLPDRYGKHANEEFKLNSRPIRSFPIHITDLPANTKAIALSLVDYDAVPVAGFPWIHWIATDIAPTDLIPEDFSQKNKGVVQGKNSNISRYVNEHDINVNERYTGPTPPETHNYTLTVYALSEPTGLKPGFYLNELMKATEPITIEKTEIKIPSRG